MKKGLSSMLSLVMIITSIFVIPTMAQADENPVLPISGTINNVCPANSEDYYAKDELRTRYTYVIQSPGTLRINVNASLTGYDSDGQFSVQFRTEFSKKYFISDMSSGYKGYVNDHVEYEILPSTYTFELCTWGNDSPVNCEISTSFTPKAQSFYADNNTVTNVIAHGNEISLDKMYYGVFPACIQESSTYSELTHVPTSFSYKFKFTGGNLYAGFDGERKNKFAPFWAAYNSFHLYDGDGKSVQYSTYNNETLLYKNLKAGEYFISIDNWAGAYSFYLTQNFNKFNGISATTTKKTSKPKKAKIKKVKGYKKALEVRYAKVSGASGYQIQVATDKKFKKNKKTVTAKKSKTKVKISKLKKKKKYYVRVRAYKSVSGKKVYGAWSKVKTVKTK